MRLNGLTPKQSVQLEGPLMLVGSILGLKSFNIEWNSDLTGRIVKIAVLIEPDTILPDPETVKA